jgi:Icc-related predicted phosphoesterase
MKLALASDLHLEFDNIVLKNEKNADVLILSGDICVAKTIEKFIPFFANCANEFPHVVYVAGNHEHYGYDFKHTISDIKKVLANLPNIHLLDKETFALNDVTFIGGTLWTDMNDEDSLTMLHVKRVMSDYHVIENSNRMVQRKVPLYELNPDYTEDGKNGGMYKLNEKGYNIFIGEKIKEEPARFAPEDTVEDHRKMLEYIKLCTAESNQKFVVVGHHAPSKLSTHPRYQHDTTMNGAYSSDLIEFIMERPQIKLWTHGHTHDVFDYMIGTTRVSCNPRGYSGYEQRAENFELKYLEV